MQMIGEEYNPKKEKNKKLMTIIIVLIVILIFICIGLFAAITYFQGKELKLYIDGAKQSSSSLASDLFIVKDNKVYVSIQDMAGLVSYEYLKGEPKNNVEDSTKGFVRPQEEIREYGEITGFTAGSNKIYKTTLEQQTIYNYTTVNNEIILNNGKIYASQEEIGKIFDMNFVYDSNENTINIFTLKYLVDYYTAQITNYDYTKLSEDLANRKAILDGYLVGAKGDTEYGVKSIKNELVLSNKYTKIEYIPVKEQFLVTDPANKVGLVDNKGNSKIQAIYDSLETLDDQTNLYIAKSNNKYGVVDENGKIIIHLEFDKIGINTEDFPNNDIKNPYLLFDNAIPVKQGEMWGMYDKTGVQILPLEYGDIGCRQTTVNNKSVINVAVLPKYEAIVVKKNDLYGIVNSKGEKLIAPYLTFVYSEQSNGITEDYMEYIGQKLKVSDYLKPVAQTKAGTQENEQTNTTNTISNNTVQTNTVVNNATGTNGNVASNVAQ